MMLLSVFVALVFLHSLVSARLARTIVTAPIVFTVAGMLAFGVLPEFRESEHSLEVFLQVAEVGLVLLLFSDASRTPLGVLRRIRELPTRLLSVGMLLTILLGGIAAVLLFPGFTLWEAAILAAILAPTDAGLGQVIVTNTRVPVKIRQALNVEAGLNDGLSVPFLLFFMALSGAGEPGGEAARLARFIHEQLGYGVLVGAGIGWTGGFLLGKARHRHWMAESWQRLGVVALPLLCAIGSEAVGASMFIAAFVAGLCVQVGFRQVGKHSVEFAEEWGQLLNLSVFFLFGLLIARAWDQFHWAHALYAVASLTIVRMLPVSIALLGTGLSRASVMFMAWFGPRGLASIVLGLVYLEQHTNPADDRTIRLAVMMTVVFSIFAHGLSAVPGIHWYSRRLQILPRDALEFSGSEPGVAEKSGR